jgi:hypothetical protein
MIMFEATPQSTFRGLPLTAEQDATIRHYIKGRKQRGARWDTPELDSMLSDMLTPPGDEDDAFSAGASDRRSALERATASLDESMEPIEASEERQAAIEAEAMKHPE